MLVLCSKPFFKLLVLPVYVWGETTLLGVDTGLIPRLREALDVFKVIEGLSDTVVFEVVEVVTVEIVAPVLGLCTVFVVEMVATELERVAEEVEEVIEVVDPPPPT